MMTKDPMIPRPFRIEKVRKELSDTFTIDLTPDDGGPQIAFKPGQFNMLYTFGVGEVPISISGDPTNPAGLTHTTRAVGKVTEALRGLKEGDVIGVRGPFGSDWQIQENEGQDIVFIAGGIGLAPLRPAIYQVLANRERYGKVLILYGARTPEDILYGKQLKEWRGRFDLDVRVTVDRATGKWAGNVGVVTKLISSGGFDPQHTTALICGPEVMMRYCVQALNDKGVQNDTIYVSMERNMKCAVGFCGHCQWGGAFVCKDGPVFRFDAIEDVFTMREI